MRTTRQMDWQMEILLVITQGKSHELSELPLRKWAQLLEVTHSSIILQP